MKELKELKLSQEAYYEINNKLLAIGHADSIIDGMIDLNGIVITVDEKE